MSDQTLGKPELANGEWVPVPGRGASLRVAPGLFRLGLLRNEPWVRNATDEADILFSPDSQRNLQIAAVLIAGLDPYALDYLKQAPVIALAASAGGDMSDMRRMREVADRLRLMFRPGLRLRELMTLLGLAYPLRALLPRALAGSEGWFRLVTQLSRSVQPSTLAQIVPQGDRMSQGLWLSNLRHWQTHLSDRQGGDDELLFRWAARAIAEMYRDGATNSPYRRDVATVADFAIARRAEFNERWSFSSALAKAQSWHAQLGCRAAVAAALSSCGVSWTDRIEYAPLPERFEADGHQFVALRSAAELFAEGRSMGHCVVSYSVRVAGGRSRIYSIRRADRRLATLELVSNEANAQHVLSAVSGEQHVPMKTERSARHWRVAQLVGPANRTPSEEIVSAVRSALTGLSEGCGLKFGDRIDGAGGDR